MSFETPADWVRRPLYDLADYINGRATKPSEIAPSGVPVIKIAELNRGITDQTNRVPREAVQDKHWVRPGDLLFAWSGTVGIHLYEGELGALNQHIFRVVSAPGIDQGFLRCLLDAQMPVFNARVADKRTTMGHVTVADLKALSVLVPPLSEQRRIAEVLGALSAYAEAERKVERTARELATTLFQKEFVATQDVDGETAALSLVDVARFVNGRNFTRGATGTGRPVIRIKEMRTGLSDATVWNEVDAHDDNVAFHDDLLFSWSGTLTVQRWSGPEGLVNQHIFKVIPLGDWPLWFVEGWVNHHLPRFRRIAAAKATTMGHIQRGDLKASVVQRPPADALQRMNPVITGICNRAAVATQGARDALALRAALLPRLVSGRIRVPYTTDVGEAIAAVSGDLAGEQPQRSVARTEVVR
jgi:type I restriction enzyme, S subunit